MSNLLIESLGVYLPEREVSTEDVINQCQAEVKYPLKRLTGIESRRMCHGEWSIDLAREAVAKCLELSKYEAKDIGLLISCNISRYDQEGIVTFEPSTSVHLKREFGFDNAITFDISNACAGMFTGVNMADAFIKAGMVKRALVVSGEYITHLTTTVQKEITDRNDDMRLACLTLGDSGAAVILEAAEEESVGFDDIELFTLSAHSDLCIAEPSPERHGGYVMITQSAKLHHIAISESIKHVVDKVKKQHLHRMPMGHFLMHQTARSAIHQTSTGIQSIIGEELWQATNIINNLKNRGNTSTTSHYVALWDQMLEGQINEGDSLLFAVQASGITLGVATYVMDDLPARIRAQEAPAKVSFPEPPKLFSGKAENRVKISGIGIAEPGDDPADSFELATIAGHMSLDAARSEPSDIDLLLNTGIYRNNYIVEPAVGALIAGKLGLNPDVDDWPKAKTFAFDLNNGVIGFLNACCTAQAAVRSGKFNRPIVVTSELENNRRPKPDQLIGLKECGSAVVICASKGNEGFREFLFDSYPQYVQDFGSRVRHLKGARSYIEFERDPQYLTHLRECVVKSVHRLLELDKLRISDFGTVILPQINHAFVHALAMDLRVSDDHLVVLEEDADYYTSSTPFALKKAMDSGQATPGSLGLIVEAGSGIQVACATYQF